MFVSRCPASAQPTVQPVVFCCVCLEWWVIIFLMTVHQFHQFEPESLCRFVSLSCFSSVFVSFPGAGGLSLWFCVLSLVSCVLVMSSEPIVPHDWRWGQVYVLVHPSFAETWGTDRFWFWGPTFWILTCLTRHSVITRVTLSISYQIWYWHKFDKIWKKKSGGGWHGHCWLVFHLHEWSERAPALVVVCVFSKCVTSRHVKVKKPQYQDSKL